ncbi:hypothetical protein HPP92_019294 [Vanilla planifolia]|uniref:Ferric oxidoreductase domain-containing protein n=1 Tax=Vanilla planifolia TaxID=51239 RepID=A0A835ULJ6_VANPL|nr:hypothetical protein HPP92_019294 [Vanilla planifolia]
MRTLGPDFDFKQPTYPDLLASTPGWTGILMIILMGFSFTLATHSFRRNVVKLPSPFHYLAGFNAFWYAHHLLAVVYVLLIVHSFFIFLTHVWYKKTVSTFPSQEDINLFNDFTIFGSKCLNYADMDVYYRSIDILYLRETDQSFSREALSCEYCQGNNLSWKCAINTHDKATRIQV